MMMDPKKTVQPDSPSEDFVKEVRDALKGFTALNRG